MPHRSSTVTRRAAAVSDTASTTGSLAIHAETITVQTRERVEIVDLTDRVAAFTAAHPVREGIVTVWSLHTTCAIFINESQQALHADIKRFLEEVVARDAAWMHNDPAHSDCDRSNADAHLRALLLGHSLTLQVTGGEPALGHWQRVLMAELDGPRERSIRLQIMGTTGATGERTA
ncbi:MAG TPA: secondary thiamine-phosphate synthase enzyme YjbQ [Vicinamibacterales bacterium]|nr:secondary thiamine-phosphate synthase enzyme YjbQ [Vicinamibacterales bacterium]